MSFLRRLFGGPPTASTLVPQVAVAQPRALQRMRTIEFTQQRDDAWLDVVGESAYEAAIEEILAELGPDGLPSVNKQALVEPEPDNRWDANALTVRILRPDGRASLVGYLSREHAAMYGAVMRTIAPAAISVRAQVRPSWSDSGRTHMPPSVRLHLGSPGELLAELWLDQHPIREDHRWSGSRVAFTGASNHALFGIRIDRAGMAYIAGRAGCEVLPRVTKTVSVCIASQLDQDTGNQKKALQYGVPIIQEGDFWADLGVELPKANR